MKNKSLMVALTARALALALTAAPAFAGDPVAGENTFKKCKACHSIIGPDGTVIQKGGMVGPNLYGLIGRQIGTQPDFAAKYGPSILAAGSDGTLWDETILAAYLMDPATWLQEKTGDAASKSKMSFKLAKGGEDVAAYLASVVPPAP